MQRDLANLFAHSTQPETQGRKRKAGHREQEADADCKSMGFISGTLRTASSDESIRAAEGGGKHHERTDRAGEPAVASREVVYAYLDPKKPPHRQHPWDCRNRDCFAR